MLLTVLALTMPYLYEPVVDVVVHSAFRDDRLASFLTLKTVSINVIAYTLLLNPGHQCFFPFRGLAGKIIGCGKLRSSAEKSTAINSALLRPGGEDQERLHYVRTARKFYPKLRTAVSVQRGASRMRGPGRFLRGTVLAVNLLKPPRRLPDF